MNPLKVALAKVIKQKLAYININQELELIISNLGETPNLSYGHYAFPCFTLAKILKTSPFLIASELKTKFTPSEFIDKIENQGAYLNFFLNPKILGELIIKEILSNDFFIVKGQNKFPKTMIEYSQPNTHKELHVGHMRNICLGDALVKSYKYCKTDVISTTFPGDMGTHVAKCLWFLKYHNKEKIPENNKGAWLGMMYSKGHVKLENDVENTINNKKQLSEILLQIENKKGEFYDLWKETRLWSIQQMEALYSWTGILFDKWYWESEVDASSIQFVNEYYKQGKLVKSKGAIGIDLEEYNLGFCMLIKSDGHGLYATKDLALGIQKFKDFSIEKSIYIVDKRQAHHFKQVFKTLELLGFENAKKCYHLAYEFVALPDGIMSSRQGNIIPIMELVNKMEAKITKQLKLRNSNSWSVNEITETAQIIAKGAIKYAMLKADPNRKIIFDIDKWLDVNGDSGPYLQYVYTRINSLLKKQKHKESDNEKWNLLNKSEEVYLIILLSKFNEIVFNVALEYKPNLLCIYLFDLAKAFNSFYEKHSIAKAKNKEVGSARLSLSKAVSLVLEKGLELLGIPVPEKM